MENICYPVVIMGERAIAGTVQAWMAWRFVEASRRVCYAINGHRTRFEIRADNRRFHNLFASLVTLSLTQGFCKSYRNFLSRRSLCVWIGFRACFFETGTLSVCLAFFDPRGFP